VADLRQFDRRVRREPVARRHERLRCDRPQFRGAVDGGFSTHDDSVAHFDSMSISLILALFMFLGGANFGLHFMMFRNRSLGAYRRDSEFRAYTAIMLSMSAFVTVMLLVTGTYDSWVDALPTVCSRSCRCRRARVSRPTNFAAWPTALPS
jgi:trk system potassium uptake protein TrkH